MVEHQKTIVLTGGSRGIGHATGKYFWKAGWRVITCSRQPFPKDHPGRVGPENYVQIDLGNRMELEDGIVPFIPSPAEALAEAGISEDQCQFFNTRTAANDWARAICHDIAEHKDRILVVFDLEWPIATEQGMETETQTCQALVYNERTRETLVAVLDLWAMGATDRDSFPKSF